MKNMRKANNVAIITDEKHFVDYTVATLYEYGETISNLQKNLAKTQRCVTLLTLALVGMSTVGYFGYKKIKELEK